MMAKLRNKPFEILCGMLGHAAWRLLLAATIIALIPSTLAANYGEACSYHSDCTDKSAPFCKTYLVDYSPHLNNKADETSGVPKPMGVCVQCLSECNCGENQYCGVDLNEETRKKFIPAASSDNSGSGMTDYWKKSLELTVKALGGKPMRSACLDIVPKNDVLCTATANLGSTEYLKYAKYVTEYNKANDKSYDKLRIPQSTPTGAPICGKVADGASIPEFYPMDSTLTLVESVSDQTKYRATDSRISSSNNANTVGVCPTYVQDMTEYECCKEWECSTANGPTDCSFLADGTTATPTAKKEACDACKSRCASGMTRCERKCHFEHVVGGTCTKVKERFGVQPSSYSCTAGAFITTGDMIPFTPDYPVMEWSGFCSKGECLACMEEEVRCNAAGQRSQTCVGGRWVWTDNLKDYSLEYMHFSASAKANVTVAFFCIIATFATIIFAVVFCLCMKPTEEERKQTAAYP